MIEAHDRASRLTYPDGQFPTGARRRGRPPSTTRAEIERLTIELFLERGFEETTIDDIATRAGIGRRTFFRYFASKNDVPWGEFDAGLDRMRGLLTDLSVHLTVLDALRTAVLDFNRVDADEAPWLRRRMQLILTVPALQAHSMIKYAQWRQTIAGFVAQRTGTEPTGLLPQSVGWAALGVSIAAYEQWLAAPAADLDTLLDAAYRALAEGFDPDVQPDVEPAVAPAVLGAPAGAEVPDAVFSGTVTGTPGASPIG